MLKNRDSSHLRDDVRIGATWVGEALFVLAAIVFGLMVVGALIGLNPLSTPVTIAALIVIPVIFLGRARWYRRHRDEIERSGVPHARRERRGF
jgi:hypothetical protein